MTEEADSAVEHRLRHANTMGGGGRRAHDGGHGMATRRLIAGARERMELRCLRTDEEDAQVEAPFIGEIQHTW